MPAVIPSRLSPKSEDFRGLKSISPLFFFWIISDISQRWKSPTS
jgi:hypothetical protein